MGMRAEMAAAALASEVRPGPETVGRARRVAPALHAAALRTARPARHTRVARSQLHRDQICGAYGSLVHMLGALPPRRRPRAELQAANETHGGGATPPDRVHAQSACQSALSCATARDEDPRGDVMGPVDCCGFTAKEMDCYRLSGVKNSIPSLTFCLAALNNRTFCSDQVRTKRSAENKPDIEGSVLASQIIHLTTTIGHLWILSVFCRCLPADCLPLLCHCLSSSSSSFCFLAVLLS